MSADPLASAAAAATSTGAAAAAASATAAAAIPDAAGLLAHVADFFSLHHMGNADQKYIENFTFTPGVTPLSSAWGVALCVLLYFATIRALQALVRARGKPFKLTGIVVVHNSLMSIGSAVLWFAMLCELGRIWSTHGLWSLGCDPQGKHTSGTIYFIYFVNYIFKYVELIDTFLLALRGKPIPFLHSYHHAATLVLCWSQLWAQSCIQWLPIVINLLVHVLMYAYYALHALRVPIWWKKYLTRLQIGQFIVALIGCCLAFGLRIAAQNFHVLPVAEYACWGTHEGAWVGIAIIASYLYLFIVLYRNTYKRNRDAAAAKKQLAEEQAAPSGTALRSRGVQPLASLDEAVANGHSKSAAYYSLSQARKFN